MAEKKKKAVDKETLMLEYKESGKDYRVQLLISWFATVVFLPSFVWMAYLGVARKSLLALYLALAFSLIWLFIFEAFYVSNERLKLRMRRMEGRKGLGLTAGIARFSRVGQKETYLYSINIIRWCIFGAWFVFVVAEIIRFLFLPNWRL
jgi:hypothetical protein